MIKMPAHHSILTRPCLLLDGVVKNEYPIVLLNLVYRCASNLLLPHPEFAQQIICPFLFLPNPL